MRRHLDRDLERLRRGIARMAGHVEAALAAATHALLARDPAAAAEAAAGDDPIDALENTLHEDCLKVMALHQPVAADLRRVAATLLAATDLERAGDLAAHVAERAAALARGPAVPVPARLAGMAAAVADMVRAAVDAFLAGDPARARAVIAADDRVDADNAAVIAELVGWMGGAPDRVEPGLSLFSATRHLEHIADAAVSVAEAVVFLAEGDHARHRPRPDPGG